jgi:ABC-2 type transport system permease protein
MKQFKSFIIKEARHILRDKRTMLILFGMPVVMMLLFGFAISTDVRNVRTAVVLSYVDHQTHKMVERLGANEYFDILYKVDNSAAAEQLIRHQKADVAIVFGRNKAIQVMTDGADPNMAQMYANYATMILQSSDTSVMTQKLLFNPQMRSCYNFVPGIMGMLLLLVCAMMTSISIVKEKERGTMEVLLVSPIRPLMIIIAKAVPYLVLAFVILCTILSISKYVLLVPISGSLFWIFLVSCIYIIVALSLGLLISTVAKTQLVALLTNLPFSSLPPSSTN